MKMLLVEWIDSCHSSGWQPLKDAEDCHIDACTSIGYLISENEREVVIAQSHTDRASGNNHVDAVMAIPRVAITRMRELQEV